MTLNQNPVRGESMPPEPSPTHRGVEKKGAVEWLYIFFFGGGIVLLLLILLLAFFTTGKLTQQAERVVELSGRVNAMDAEIARLSRMLSAKPAPTTGSPATSPVERPNTQRATTRPSRAATNPTDELTDESVQSALKSVIAASGAGLPEIRDASAAGSLLARAAQARNLTGATWESLAILARRLDDDERAKRFASSAEAAGKSTERYEEVSARQFLSTAHPAEAAIYARALARRKGKEPVAGVLMAALSIEQRNLPLARRSLSGISDFSRLSPQDRLLAGQVAVALERWDDLTRALAGLTELPEDLTFQRDYLNAVASIAAGKFAEAVAILDFLIDQRPDNYDAMTWRGVALMRARQPDAARQTLTRASGVAPGRPEAWYWLGVLDINQGKSEAGQGFLHNALAASSKFGPAWEALAGESLNAGDVVAALDQTNHAIALDPERAAPYFLLALCHAKAARREEAAEALRKAFSLDRSLLDRALKTEILTRMFDDLAGLVPDHATTQPES